MHARGAYTYRVGARTYETSVWAPDSIFFRMPSPASPETIVSKFPRLKFNCFQSVLFLILKYTYYGSPPHVDVVQVDRNALSAGKSVNIYLLNIL